MHTTLTPFLFLYIHFSPISSPFPFYLSLPFHPLLYHLSSSSSPTPSFSPFSLILSPPSSGPLFALLHPSHLPPPPFLFFLPLYPPLRFLSLSPIPTYILYTRIYFNSISFLLLTPFPPFLLLPSSLPLLSLSPFFSSSSLPSILVFLSHPLLFPHLYFILSPHHLFAPLHPSHLPPPPFLFLSLYTLPSVSYYYPAFLLIFFTLGPALTLSLSSFLLPFPPFHSLSLLIFALFIPVSHPPLHLSPPLC